MTFSTELLNGRHVLVTGASSGLGRDLAIAAAGAGARVTITGRNEERLAEVRAAMAVSDHAVLVGDVSSIDGAHDLVVRAAREQGALDGVFHAAGIAAVRLAKTINNDHVQQVFGAAVYGAFGIGKACAKRNVMNDGGSILLMSSVAAQRGKAGMTVYSSAKAAVGGFVRSLAAELAARSIRVNEIVAGAIETPMHESIVRNLDAAGIDDYREMHLLGFGAPSDITNSALFLLSDASRWITGAAISVDGGYTAI